MSISRIILLAAIVLMVVAAFLPWASVDGIADAVVTGVSGRGKYGGSPGYFFIALAVISGGLGFLNKKWSHIVSMLFIACLVFLFTVIYAKDAKCEESAELALKVCPTIGMGHYLSWFSAVLLVVGNVMGFMSVPKAVAPIDETILDN